MAGEFWLNDQLLNISPEQIQVQRATVNNYWNTLRTKSSIKTRSGYSRIDITISCKFTDTDPGNGNHNGLQQLRDIVAQVRTTPFVWVENEYLRNAVLGNAPLQSMVLALKNLEIHTVQGTTNTLEVFFKFAWFNYKPFLKDFVFNQDIFLPIKVRTPAESNAFRLLYEAEQIRGKYQEIRSLSGGDNIVFDLDAFALIPKEKIEQLKKQMNALQQMNFLAAQGELSPAKSSERPGGISEKWLNSLLSTTGLDTDDINILSRQISDSATSMLSNPGNDSKTQNTPITAAQFQQILQPVIASVQAQIEWLLFRPLFQMLTEEGQK
jgi:hypothetical protein